jgi:hypothetical protein
MTINYNQPKFSPQQTKDSVQNSNNESLRREIMRIAGQLERLEKRIIALENKK